VKPRKFGIKKPRVTKRGAGIQRAVKRAVNEYKASFRRLAAE